MEKPVEEAQAGEKGTPSRAWEQFSGVGAGTGEGMCREGARDEMRSIIRGQITRTLMSGNEELALCLRAPTRSSVS